MTPALLVLEDGRVFRGAAYGAEGETFGEMVFNTGMTGYQETLTDPSYARQIVAMTSPHIGNTGINGEDPESRRIQVAGYVVREPARVASNWRATGSLGSALRDQSVVGIAISGTRALTRHLRDRGAMRAGIFSGADAVALGEDALVERVRQSPSMEGADLARDVSTKEPYVVQAEGERRFTVAAVDLGIKSMTPHRMSERGCEVHVLPATSTTEEILALAPDGVFFSNGPGDPAAAGYAVDALKGVLDAGTPFFGICFGNQIFGRALDLGTYKLRFGHRGINQPVQDRTTGKVDVSAHNHGFAVKAPTDGSFDTPYGPGEVSHVNLNDGCVEGLRLLERPAFSVQYHPEAAAGPHDASGLFDRFCELMEGSR
ncbi:carbamoyl-phosphate synthase small subunit [Actinomadura darangshiensis]|uniref:Carbamoyl phosphate synthase small chain n=1 Tax=Actinomadura darangshiensis TaxID=705336 RepID=A0A4R5BWY8_9ACTN|nr:glutamine-hydrolyzing carbamoyl-phosphate synthase small subunit [Actinomadura darangshiensis]TDD90699.1 carbamoyl-phosphate synthase small subunit [Actinomadura darangshiensis]